MLAGDVTDMAALKLATDSVGTVAAACNSSELPFREENPCLGASEVVTFGCGNAKCGALGAGQAAENTLLPGEVAEGGGRRDGTCDLEDGCCSKGPLLTGGVLLLAGGPGHDCCAIKLDCEGGRNDWPDDTDDGARKVVVDGADSLACTACTLPCGACLARDGE